MITFEKAVLFNPPLLTMAAMALIALAAWIIKRTAGTPGPSGENVPEPVLEIGRQYSAEIGQHWSAEVIPAPPAVPPQAPAVRAVPVRQEIGPVRKAISR